MTTMPNPTGPGPGESSQMKAQSYADRARMNVKFDQRLKRNVLEIEIEKDNYDEEMFLDQETVARLLNRINMDIKQVEGYQIVYRGKTGKVSIWCKEGLDLNQFCRREILEVCKGVNTKSIHPAGRPEVTVTFQGVDFNTPDTLIQDYISKFGGKLVSDSVIYGRHGGGPFKGKVNGERRYQVDFSSSSHKMGTYHWLDGERIRVFYRGNTRTCGRCHKPSGNCPGGGIAKECQERGGARVDLIEHMKELWQSINFSPTSFTLPTEEEEVNGDNKKLVGDKNILEIGSFPSQKPPTTMTEEDKKKVTSVKITNFPIEITENEVLDFLKKKVDETIKTEDVEIVRNERSSQIILGPGPKNNTIMKAVEELHHYQYSQGRLLYTRPIRPLTPIKPNKDGNEVTKNKVKDAVKKVEIVKDMKNHSQAKLSSAGTAQVTKHKQGLGNEKFVRL